MPPSQAFGGEVISLPNPTHAKSVRLYFTPNALFEGIPQGIQVALIIRFMSVSLGGVRRWDIVKIMCLWCLRLRIMIAMVCSFTLNLFCNKKAKGL